MDRFVLFAMVILTAWSCGSGSGLTDTEFSKLDPMLQSLLSAGTGTPERYDITRRTDGTEEYGIIVRTSAPEELRAAGVVPNSIVGEIVTVRATLEEVRAIARLASVRGLQSATMNTLHNSR
jgi:hypothetical protein